jgi:hypothetical protein
VVFISDIYSRKRGPRAMLYCTFELVHRRRYGPMAQLGVIIKPLSLTLESSVTEMLRVLKGCPLRPVSTTPG